VQTFLPFTDFEVTAQSLGNRRRGMRRVETQQARLTGHITTLAEFVIYWISALVVSLAVLLSWLKLRRADPADQHGRRNCCWEDLPGAA
jgi:hypothetical protein